MSALSNALIKVVSVLAMINSAVLWGGRQLAWMMIGLMVFVILLQVFCRYVLNDALPWPEEAARGLMIWMMALIAPSAYRWGGFVSITMFRDALPAVLGRILSILLLVLAGIVLYILLGQAINHFNSGFMFKSSSLKIPLAWIYLAMTFCFGLMMSVNTELLLRTIGRLIGNPEDFPLPVDPEVIGAE